MKQKQNSTKNLAFLATFCLLSWLATGCTTIRDMSTRDLKLEHSQHDRVVGAGSYAWGSAMNERNDRIKKREKIERELLKRYQAGDKEAYLPVFGN
jgi:hypothetical protein